MNEPRQDPDLVERLRGGVARLLVRLPAPLKILLSGKRRVVVDGQALDPSLQLLLAVRPAHDGLLAAGAVASRARLRREVLAVRGRLTTIGSVQPLTVMGAAGELPARLYVPVSPSTASPLLVYFHGGGFVLGGLDTHDEPCRLLAKHGAMQVLSVDYRLAPEHPFPQAVEDAVAAFRWAVANAGALRADPAEISVGGDSAGATLAAVICLLTRSEPARPRAQILIYPPTDFAAARPSHQLFDRAFMLTMEDRAAFYEQYLHDTGADRNDPRISPLRAVDLSNLPPALVVVAGFDILRDESLAFAEALNRAGTECKVHREPSLTHGFINITGTCPAAHRAVVEVARQWRAKVAAS